MSYPTPIGIYSIDYQNVVWKLLVPPDRRTPAWLEWGIALLSGKQWKADAVLGSYANGAGPVVTTPYFSGASSYSLGDRVIFGVCNDTHGNIGDNAVYEWINNSTGSAAPSVANIVPDTPPQSIVTAAANYNWATVLAWVQQYSWVKVQDNFIGAVSRAAFNSTCLAFEYALNLWFNTTFRQPNGLGNDPVGNPTGTPDIYINTNDNVDAQFMMGPSSPDSQSFMAPASPPAVYFMATVAQALSSTDFTIYIPVAVYNSLTTEASGYTTKKTQIVIAFVNTINAAGMSYNIVTY